MTCGAAEHVILTTPSKSLGKAVRELNGGHGMRLYSKPSAEAAVSPVRQGLDALAPGGTVCILAPTSAICRCLS